MRNLIQWPRAKYWTAQWNPVIGCKPCSPACEHCYAAVWAKRFGQSFEPHETKQRPPRKGVVFCGNMTDLFGEWMYNEDIANNIGWCVNRGGDAYLWLTKRPSRMCGVLRNEKVLLVPEGYDVDDGEYFGFDDEECDISNHYFGFTAEDNQHYIDRSTISAELPNWVNRWVSCEPLLGPINFGYNECFESDYKWVVVGCESGPNRRPCKLEWVERIVDFCLAAKVPVFVKQICLPNGKYTNKIEEFPEHLRIRQVPWAKKGENQ